MDEYGVRWVGDKGNLRDQGHPNLGVQIWSTDPSEGGKVKPPKHWDDGLGGLPLDMVLFVLGYKLNTLSLGLPETSIFRPRRNSNLSSCH